LRQARHRGLPTGWVVGREALASYIRDTHTEGRSGGVLRLSLTPPFFLFSLAFLPWNKTCHATRGWDRTTETNPPKWCAQPLSLGYTRRREPAALTQASDCILRVSFRSTHFHWRQAGRVSTKRTTTACRAASVRPIAARDDRRGTTTNRMLRASE